MAKKKPDSRPTIIPTSGPATVVKRDNIYVHIAADGTETEASEVSSEGSSVTRVLFRFENDRYYQLVAPDHVFETGYEVQP